MITTEKEIREKFISTLFEEGVFVDSVDFLDEINMVCTYHINEFFSSEEIEALKLIEKLPEKYFERLAKQRESIFEMLEFYRVIERQKKGDL